MMKLLARGGNGEVWTAKDIDSQNVAVKILVTLGEKRYMRFEDEVSVVESNSDIEGIIPIFSHGKIDLSSTEIPYYIMPIAQSIEIALKNRTIIEKIGLLIEVAKTLKQLHGRGISHRDLKPPNLLYYRDRICISDFGLADFPEKGDLTEKWEDIGPKWTMAPEMRRNASSADGRKADIYSFAKSIWILITNQRKGFDGQYFPDTVLDIKSLSGMEFTSPLDSLLQISTDNDPDKRPSIDTVIDELLNFQKMLENYFQRNKLQWKDVQNKLFPLGLPSRSIWEDRDDIIFILNQLAPTKDLNHMFLPDGGGLDLLGAKESYEPDCIELDFGSPIILKPKRLIFESFNYEEEWNYFRLETDKLEPSGYFEKNVDREYLTEIEPFVYSDYRCWEYDDINGNPLPEGSRPIDRITCECSFVIFQNTSQYNKIGSTYDGRHNKVSAEGFRKYIKRGIKKLKEGQGTNDHSKVVKKPKIIIPNPSSNPTTA